jgi:hypothetical protein
LTIGAEGAALTVLAISAVILWRARWTAGGALVRESARRRVWVGAGGTVLMAGLFWVAARWMDRLPVVPGDRMFLVGAAALMAGAAVCGAWVPAAACLDRRGRPAGGPVVCVACGYSMRGLADLTCPECGRRHTIDELVSGMAAATSAT